MLNLAMPVDGDLETTVIQHATLLCRLGRRSSWVPRTASVLLAHHCPCLCRRSSAVASCTSSLSQCRLLTSKANRLLPIGNAAVLHLLHL